MNLPTINDRKIPKPIIGDLVATKVVSSRRPPCLLQRNIRQILAFHKHKLTSNLGPGSAIPGHQLPSESADISTDDTASSDNWELQTKPVVDAVSNKALIARSMDPNFENSSRRSLRQLQDHVYHDDEAELAIDLISIRRKLNFKSNRLSDDGRPPRKKTKSGHVKCLCTLTLWDNRIETEEKMEDKLPLVKMHVNCALITYETDDQNRQVNIELEQPFRVKARELKVLSMPKDADEPVLSIIDDYFLELKLIPLKSEADWPPIPFMGKSEGESQRHLAALTAEKLKGSLVARYQKLPQAPEPDIPLSIFFIHDGRLHKTKFGLELSTQWAVPKIPMRNRNLRPSLVATSNSQSQERKTGQATHEKTVMAHRAKSSTTPLGTKNGSSPRTPSSARSRVRISFLFDPKGASAREIRKELRTVEVDDFQCPICVAFTAKDVLELRLHWLTTHSKYNFVFFDDGRIERIRRLRFHVMPIDAAKLSKQLDDDKTFVYLSNGSPFDARAYLDDEQGTGKARQKPRAQQNVVNISRGKPVEDPATELRKRNGGQRGYLKPEDVRDFRKPERKKHPVVLLDRKLDKKSTPYSSISHRSRSVSEDAISETDDEVDDEWFIQRHLEELDTSAQKEGWSHDKTEFLKKWNRHRLEEKIEHPRFISDSLIRFVKKEAAFLSLPSVGLRAAFADLLGKFLQSRYIEVQFFIELQAMVRQLVETAAQARAHPSEGGGDAESRNGVALEPGKPTTASTATSIQSADLLQPSKLIRQAEAGAASPSTVLHMWTEQVLSLPKYSCGVCTKAITRPHKEVTRCSNHDCPVAGMGFHLGCVGQNEPQGSWICHGCKISTLSIHRDSTCIVD